MLDSSSWRRLEMDLKKDSWVGGLAGGEAGFEDGGAFCWDLECGGGGDEDGEDAGVEVEGAGVEDDGGGEVVDDDEVEVAVGDDQDEDVVAPFCLACVEVVGWLDAATVEEL